MRKVITILVALTALFATLQAKTITETRMHIYQNGDNGEWWTPVGDVDSITFTEHTNINDSIINSHAVIFMQDDGEILQFDNLPLGATPKCAAPHRNGLPDYDVVFRCWVPNIKKVDSDILYKAKYDSLSRTHKYTVIFRDKKGSILKTLQEVTYYQAMCVSKVMYDSTMQSYRSYTDAGIEEDLISKDTLIYTIEFGKEIKSDVDGALSYPFAINDSTFVFFSKGNLQYNAGNGETHKTLDGVAQGTWRFAEKQGDALEQVNDSVVNSTYNGWIDRFCWGTSGWDNGADYYQPWNRYRYKITEGTFGPQEDLTGKYARADWGVYNAISNGGNQPNLWRTLSRNEWMYLLNHSDWTICEGFNSDVPCLLLIPKGITIPQNINLPIVTHDYYHTLSDEWYPNNLRRASFADFDNTSTSLTEKEVETLESLGVVALPFYHANNYGSYWSSNSYTENYAYLLDFNESYLSPNYGTEKNYSLYVRLVHEVKNDNK